MATTSCGVSKSARPSFLLIVVPLVMLVSNQTAAALATTPDSPKNSASTSKLTNSPAKPKACPGWDVELTARAYPLTIQSPNYPYTYYSSNTGCSWKITSPSGRIKITVVSYDIEESPGCKYDSLNIYDGDSPNSSPLAKICSSYTHDLYYWSTSNVIFVDFHSDSSNNRPRFRLTYQRVNADSTDSFTGLWHSGDMLSTQKPSTSDPSVDCPSESIELDVKSYSQSIKSPNYPSLYPSNGSCSWRITSPSGVIKITVEDYDIEESAGCVFDSLDMYDGNSIHSPPLARFCGAETHSIFIWSSSNVVYVNFHSDSTNNRPGFKLAYQSARGLSTESTYQTSTDSLPEVTTHIPDTNTSTQISEATTSSNVNRECPSKPLELRVKSYSQSIQSPNYPSSYPNNADCNWLLTSVASLIQVTIDFYDIEGSHHCRFDSLIIYDGSTSTSTPLGRFCDSAFVTTIFSSSSTKVLINFRSDGSITRSGFTLTYRTL